MGCLQAPLSKYEEGDFVNDRYDKIEERLKVGWAGWAPGAACMPLIPGVDLLARGFTDHRAWPAAGGPPQAEQAADVRREGEGLAGRCARRRMHVCCLSSRHRAS